MLDHIIADFGLSHKNMYGAISDAGSEVMGMMAKALGLRWDWCIVYMTNAATKFAFGHEPNKTIDHELPEVIDTMRIIVRLVVTADSMGSLLEA